MTRDPLVETVTLAGEIPVEGLDKNDLQEGSKVFPVLYLLSLPNLLVQSPFSEILDQFGLLCYGKLSPHSLNVRLGIPLESKDYFQQVKYPCAKCSCSLHSFQVMSLLV